MDEQEKIRIEQAKRFFDADEYVKLSGIEIVGLTEKRAVVSAKIDKKHLNANGFVQGGMLYTLADFAFAVLANFLHPITVTQCGHINYIRAANATCLTATATETARAGHNTLSEVVITDENETIVCVCNFNGFIKEIKK